VPVGVDYTGGPGAPPAQIRPARSSATRDNSPTNVTEAFQVPQAPGVQVNNVFGVYIGGNGGLNSFIDGTGGPADSASNPGIGVPLDGPNYVG
jgi:hypothetical protein